MSKERKQFNCKGLSKTEQCHKNKCDVNNVVKRYIKTGHLEQRLAQGVYGDFTSMDDFQTCVSRLQDAHNDFMALPASVRKRFDNDPGKLIHFIGNKDNYDEAVKLGLIVPKEEPVNEAHEPSEPSSDSDPVAEPSVS